MVGLIASAARACRTLGSPIPTSFITRSRALYPLQSGMCPLLLGRLARANTMTRRSAPTGRTLARATPAIGASPARGLPDALLAESLVVSAVTADHRSLVVGASILPILVILVIPRQGRAMDRGAIFGFTPAPRLCVPAG